MFVLFKATFFPRFLKLQLIFIIIEDDLFSKKAVLLGEGEEGRHRISASWIDENGQSASGEVGLYGDKQLFVKILKIKTVTNYYYLKRKPLLLRF